MNKDPYDLTPVPKKDIFTYTDMTEEDFEDIVFNCFLEHAKQSFNYPEPAIDADGIFKFSRDLRAALAAANGPLQATTSKPLPVIPWSGSNLTEMEELLQKVQQLETENVALREELQQSEDRFRNIPDEVWSKADLVEMTNKALEERDDAYKQNAALRNELAKLQEWTNQIRDDLGEACSERDANWEKVGNLVDLLIESLKHLDNHNLAREGTELVHKIKMAVIQDRGLWE